jgi:formylglycine-generating enzyme
MVDADWFLIDATEVTVADYAGFAALDFHPIVLSSPCLWKLQVEWFRPDDWDQQLEGDFDNPVRGVDWCDAEAYCKWAGKRLCGVVGGGPAKLEQLIDAPNEWHRACSDGGVSSWPYGNNYKKHACNGLDQGIADITPVASFADCVGGVEGLFDMSGNLWEWTNACGEDPGAEHWEQDCQRRGGSFHSSKDVLRCSVDSRRHRGYRDSSTGIRCCAD